MMLQRKDTEDKLFRNIHNILFVIAIIAIVALIIQTPYGNDTRPLGNFIYFLVCPLFFPFYFQFIFQKEKTLRLLLKTLLFSSGLIILLSAGYTFYLLDFCDRAPGLDSFGCSAEPFPLASIGGAFGIWNLIANFFVTVISVPSFFLIQKLKTVSKHTR